MSSLAHVDTPPCIVLGVETQIGLAIIRELGKLGVRVVAISHDPYAIGLRSRYVWRKETAGPPRSEAVIEAVRALGEELGPCSLMSVSEANLKWLQTNRNEFGKVRPITPKQVALDVVLDKQLTLRAAQAVGIQVPHTDEPGSLEAIDRIASSFPYPAVLKWKDANTIAPKLSAVGIDFIKAEYIYDADQLHAVGQRYAPLGQWPLIQQYCPGHGLGQFFFMHRGNAIRRFQHVRIAEWPPEGGFSSVCDAVPLNRNRELQQKSIELLKSIGWEGVAMVEYRLDPTTGRAVLMEINGRYWGSLPLAVHAGAGFALLAHQAAMDLPLASLPRVLDNLRCRMVTTEIKRLVLICLAPGKIKDRNFCIDRRGEILRFLYDFFSPRVRYYLWQINDPWPFFADLGNVCRKLMRRK